MDSILNTRSVGSGMVRLLQDFCNVNNLNSPINHAYSVDERIPLSRWLQKLKYVDNQFKKEGLGLEIAKYCNASHIGICAYIAMSCKTLNEYVTLPKEYITIWYDQAPKQISILNNKIVISESGHRLPLRGAGAAARPCAFRRETAAPDPAQPALQRRQVHAGGIGRTARQRRRERRSSRQFPAWPLQRYRFRTVRPTDRWQ